MAIFGWKKKNTSIVQSKITIEDRSNTENINTEPVLIMANDGVNICAEACACCWDTKIPAKTEDRAEYIAKRTRIGHGSVTEHSNHVFYMEIPDDEIIYLAEFLSSYTEYVHTVYRHSIKLPKGYLIIGGSWRAYRDIILKSPNVWENPIIRRLLDAIYKTMSYAGFADLVKKEVIPDRFENPNSVGYRIYSKANWQKIGDNLEIINVDDFDMMVKNLIGLCPEAELFTYYDLLDMCTITVLFKNMSRIITQQLTRHRNAITQESQRYVNYANGAFNSPAMFKDKYDPKYQYSVQFGKSSQKMTLQEIGDNIAGIYGQLIDKDRTQGHDLQREDARAYLPNNIRCNKLYMTFTWRNFFSFLHLREEAHAQAEIRKYAIELGDYFRTHIWPNGPDFNTCINGYTESNEFCVSLNYPTNIVDEVISEEEITSEMEDYAANSVEGEPFVPMEKE